MDDDNDSNFNSHVFGDLSSNHRMCSFGEWNLCKEIFNKDNIINNIESQLEDNCSEEVILLRERVILLEKHVEMLKEKLYANENVEHARYENVDRNVRSSGEGASPNDPPRSRLTRRRNPRRG